MKPTFKIYPRVNAIKVNGNIPFYCRLSINRKSRWYSLDSELILPDRLKSEGKTGKNIIDEEKAKDFIKQYWDPQRVQVKKYRESNPVRLTLLNQELEKYETSARQIIHDYNITSRVLSFDEFEEQFRISGVSRSSFYDFARDELKIMKQMQAPSETLRSYGSYISKLEQFTSKLSFGDITLEFIQKYHAYMINRLGNCENTCNTSLAFIRTMLNRAIKKGIIKENVFDKYSIKRVPGHRDYLTDDELEALENFYYNQRLKKYHANVLRYFLFSCYTGLRFQDIKMLTRNDIKQEFHTGSPETLIRIKMHKTRDEVSIPVIPQALKLIPQVFNNQRVFRVTSNQKTNFYLKDIIKLFNQDEGSSIKIDKNITFHCARHTFATSGLTKGIPFEVVSKLLGHRDLKATGIYGRILDAVKIREMKRWNNNAELD